MRDNGGHMVALKWTMKNHYDVDPGETYLGGFRRRLGGRATPTSATRRCCTAARRSSIEGKPVGTPDAGAFWRVIAEHGVAAMFTAPTAFRAIKKEDPKGEHIKRYDLRAFRTLFLAGERADPETIKWAESQPEGAGLRPLVADRDRLADLRQPGGARRAAGEVRLAHRADAGLRPAGAGRRRPSRVKPGETGTLAIKLPLPPSCLPTLWDNDERFRNSYLAEFPGYYTTSDAGYMDADGYAFVMARTDDVINVAGPPPLDRADGGGGRPAQGRGRMRRGRRGR